MSLPCQHAVHVDKNMHMLALNQRDAVLSEGDSATLNGGKLYVSVMLGSACAHACCQTQHGGMHVLLHVRVHKHKHTHTHTHRRLSYLSDFQKSDHVRVVETCGLLLRINCREPESDAGTLPEALVSLTQTPKPQPPNSKLGRPLPLSSTFTPNHKIRAPSRANAGRANAGPQLTRSNKTTHTKLVAICCFV